MTTFFIKAHCHNNNEYEIVTTIEAFCISDAIEIFQDTNCGFKIYEIIPLTE